MFSLDDYQKAERYFQDRGISKEVAESFGLALDRGPSGLRITIPIRDLRGEYRGCLYRELEGDRKFTALAELRAHVYGLDAASEDIRRDRFAFLLEGFSDCWAAHSLGLVNAVALGGLSISIPQIALLRRFTHRIYVIMDNDDSGSQASYDVEEKLVASGFSVTRFWYPGDCFEKDVGDLVARDPAWLVERIIGLWSFSSGPGGEGAPEESLSRLRRLLGTIRGGADGGG